MLGNYPGVMDGLPQASNDKPVCYNQPNILSKCTVLKLTEASVKKNFQWYFNCQTRANNSLKLTSFDMFLRRGIGGLIFSVNHSCFIVCDSSQVAG